MIRLALLTRRAPAAAGLLRMLAVTPDIELLAVERDEVALARRLAGRRPDVLVVDRGWGSASAIGVCRRIKARRWAPPVVVYTADTPADLVDAALADHVDGIIVMGEAPTTAAAVLRRVAGGVTAR